MIIITINRSSALHSTDNGSGIIKQMLKFKRYLPLAEINLLDMATPLHHNDTINTDISSDQLPTLVARRVYGQPVSYARWYIFSLQMARIADHAHSHDNGISPPSPAPLPESKFVLNSPLASTLSSALATPSRDSKKSSL